MLRERDREEASLSQNVSIIYWTEEKSLKWNILEEHTCDKHKKGIVYFKMYAVPCSIFSLDVASSLTKEKLHIVILGAII